MAEQHPALDENLVEPEENPVIIIEHIENTIEYPGILTRVKAAFVDAVILIVMMMIASNIFSNLNDVPNGYRMATFFFVFFLYEPILVSFFGGTIGHLAVKIKVKRSRNPEKNLFFPLALLRFAVKGLLGWISLLTISGNKNHQAIHDMVVGSIVLFRKQELNE